MHAPASRARVHDSSVVVRLRFLSRRIQDEQKHSADKFLKWLTKAREQDQEASTCSPSACASAPLTSSASLLPQAVFGNRVTADGKDEKGQPCTVWEFLEIGSL